MAGNLDGTVEDSNQSACSEQSKGSAHGSMGDRIVVLVEANIQGLARFDREHQIGIEGMARQLHQPGDLFLEGFLHGPTIVPGAGSLGRDFVSPNKRLAIEVDQVCERTSGKERIAYESNASLHHSLFIASGGPTGPRGKVIVRGQLHESGIEVDGVSKALQHGGAQVVPRGQASRS